MTDQGGVFPAPLIYKGTEVSLSNFGKMGRRLDYWTMEFMKTTPFVISTPRAVEDYAKFMKGIIEMYERWDIIDDHPS